MLFVRLFRYKMIFRHILFGSLVIGFFRIVMIFGRSFRIVVRIINELLASYLVVQL